MSSDRPTSSLPSPHRAATLKPGDVLLVDGAASVQFGGGRRLLFRVIRVNDGLTYDGWIWLRGYTLDNHYEAVGQRDIFVQVAGIRAAPHRVASVGGRP